LSRWFSVMISMSRKKYYIVILLLLLSIMIFGYHEAFADPNGGTFDVPHIEDEFTKFIVYDRDKAIQYAKKWSDPDNQGNFNPEWIVTEVTVEEIAPTLSPNFCMQADSL
jgi:hypothetical protein